MEDVNLVIYFRVYFLFLLFQQLQLMLTEIIRIHNHSTFSFLWSEIIYRCLMNGFLFNIFRYVSKYDIKYLLNELFQEHDVK